MRTQFSHRVDIDPRNFGRTEITRNPIRFFVLQRGA
jgi:hypothetical protein